MDDRPRVQGGVERNKNAGKDQEREGRGEHFASGSGAPGHSLKGARGPAVHTTAVHTTAVHATAVPPPAVPPPAVHATAVHTTAVHTTAVHTTAVHPASCKS